MSRARRIEGDMAASTEIVNSCVEDFSRRPIHFQSTKSARAFLKTSSNFSAVTFPTE